MRIKHFALRKLGNINREELLRSLSGTHKVMSADWIQQKYWASLVRKLSSKELFSLIYAKNLWSSTESVSGPGSTLQATGKLRDVLPGLLNSLDVRTILDIPCGDFNWMKHVELENMHYIGADIVPDLVENNLKLYNAKNRDFLCLNIITDSLPKADIILCRDGLVHLSDKDVLKALSNIKNSGSTYLLTTHFPQHLINKGIGKDYWRPINLKEKPFNLPPPILLINEGHEEPEYSDKSLGLWQIKDI